MSQLKKSLGFKRTVKNNSIQTTTKTSLDDATKIADVRRILAKNRISEKAYNIVQPLRIYDAGILFQLTGIV